MTEEQKNNLFVVLGMIAWIANETQNKRIGQMIINQTVKQFEMKEG